MCRNMIKYVIYETNSGKYAKRVDTDAYYSLGNYNCMMAELLEYAYDGLDHAKYEFGFIARRGQKKGHKFEIHKIVIDTKETVENDVQME